MIRRIHLLVMLVLLLAFCPAAAENNGPRAFSAGIAADTGVNVVLLLTPENRLAIVIVSGEAVCPGLRALVLGHLPEELGIDSGNLLLVARGSGDAPPAERIARVIGVAAGRLGSARVFFGRASLRGLIRDRCDPAGPLDEALFTLEVRTEAGPSMVIGVLPTAGSVLTGLIPLVGSGGACVLLGEDAIASRFEQAGKGAVPLSARLSIETRPVGKSGGLVQRISIGELTILTVPGELGPGVGVRCRAVESSRTGGPVVLIGRANGARGVRPDPPAITTALGLEAALPERHRSEPAPAVRTEVVRPWMPGRYRVDRVWYRTPLPSGVPENDLYPVEYFIPKRQATAALIVLPMWKGGSLIAERTVAGNLASHGYLIAILPLPYQFQRAPKGVRSGNWTVSGDLTRTRNVMLQAKAEIEELTTRLAARADVTRGRVGVLGISLGAHVAAVAYQTDPRLKAGIFVMAGGDLASLLWRDVPETRRMRAEIKARGFTREDVEEKLRLLDPARAQEYPAWPTFPRYRGVLMFNATKDTIVPPENAKALHAALGHPAIHWFPETHYSMALRIPEILGIVHRHLAGLFR